MNKNLKILLIIGGVIAMLMVSATIGAMTSKEYYCEMCGSEDLEHIDYGSPVFECNECGHEGYMPYKQSTNLNTFAIITSMGLILILLIIHGKVVPQ